MRIPNIIIFCRLCFIWNYPHAKTPIRSLSLFSIYTPLNKTLVYTTTYTKALMTNLLYVTWKEVDKQTNRVLYFLFLHLCVFYQRKLYFSGVTELFWANYRNLPFHWFTQNTIQKSISLSLATQFYLLLFLLIIIIPSLPCKTRVPYFSFTNDLTPSLPRNTVWLTANYTWEVQPLVMRKETYT